MPTPETSAFHQELASALASAAASLPKKLCDVFQLHSVSGLSLKQVAAKTGLTLPAAKSRLFRAHARMRKSLEPVWSNPHGAAAWRTGPNSVDSEVQQEAA